MAQRLKGIPVMPGLGLGYAVILKSTLPPEIDERILPGDVGEELKKFQDAVNQACRSLEQIRDEAAKKAGDQEAAIFEAQLLMLQDPSLLDLVSRRSRDLFEPFPPAAGLRRKRSHAQLTGRSLFCRQSPGCAGCSGPSLALSDGDSSAEAWRLLGPFCACGR